MRLSIHRLHEYDTAQQLLANLRGRYDRIALSTMDPVSSAIFFHREVSLFFDRYVRTGQESIFGKVSHYYATVTNDRGSLHLHGFLWLHGNMRLPSLIDDMANPEEGEFRAKAVRYLDSVFYECLDEDAGKAIRQDRKPIHTGQRHDGQYRGFVRSFPFRVQLHCILLPGSLAHLHLYQVFSEGFEGPRH